jgi:hypothetical protein
MYLTNSPVVVSYSEKIKMKKSCEFESRSWRSALDTTLSDKVCQWLETGRLFSPGTPISSTNKTYHQDVTEILLNVALNTINQPTIRISFKFFLEVEVKYPEDTCWLHLLRS